MAALFAKIGRLFHELTRRRVARVAVAYLVAGWVVIQVAATALPLFFVPGWVAQAIAIGVLAGFPVAVGLAWVFDVTPQGVERTAATAQPEAERPGPAARPRWPVYVGLAAAVVLLVVFAFADVTSPLSKRQAIGSIAVLPFEDMSAAGRDQYFGDGIAEELLNVLARAPGLHVAARTSSFSFRKGTPVTRIGRELGVEAVLEGSVRRDAGRLRITAQLIDAKTGFHIWSDTYDREAGSVFTVQDDIAGEILRALGFSNAARGDRGAAARADVDIEAHDLYLLGLHYWHRRGAENLLRALELFGQAAERDPTLAKAHAGLALTYAVFGSHAVNRHFEGLSDASAREYGRAAALRALALDPGNAEAHAALGQIALNYDWDLGEAERQNRRAIALNPNFATAHQWLAEALMGQLRLEEATVAAERAVQLDPRGRMPNTGAALVEVARGRFDRARSYLQVLIDSDPADPAGRKMLRDVAMRTGRYAEALELMYAIGCDSAASAAVVGAVEAGASPERWVPLARTLEDVPCNFFTTQAQALQGNPAPLLEQLSLRFDEHNANLAWQLPYIAELAGLTGHPDIAALYRRIAETAGA